MWRKQRGFTLYELFIVLLIVLGLALALGMAGTIIYVLQHFIVKFW